MNTVTLIYSPNNCNHTMPFGYVRAYLHMEVSSGDYLQLISIVIFQRSQLDNLH